MRSERRLHPLSFLFSLGSRLRAFLVPGLVVLVGAGSAGWDWQAWLLLVLIPSTFIAIVRSLSVRYRFDESELVIATGVFVRNERHVPYARVQNIDAVQNLVHRALGVVDVRVQTGGGDEPEATLSVLPLAALEEMRERVFAGRAAAAPDAIREVSPEVRETLLRLGPRDLALHGFVESRGLVIIGAAFGLLWEVGILDRAVDAVTGESASGRGIVREVVRAVFGGGTPSASRVALALAALVVFVLVMRVLSMGWSLIRLHGFALTRTGDDLRAQYGLFTRIIATVPLHRIQIVTISEGPLHRLFRRSSVRVDSAGGDGGREASARRESLAPIIRRNDLPGLVRSVLPEIDLAGVRWSPVDPGAFRRVFKRSLIVAALTTVPFVAMLKWWTLALLALLGAWAWLNARFSVRHLGWAIVDANDPGASSPGAGAMLFRSGWVSRRISIARFTKIQAVTFSESPFDRRARHASVRIDTAGAGDLSHRVDVPYLARETARALYELLAVRAARTAFRW
jgi:putative membrane protein